MFLKQFFQRIREFFSSQYKAYQVLQAQSNEVAEDLLVANFERLTFVGYLALPVHALHILLFLDFSGTPKEMQWRNGIILSHSALFIFACLLVMVTWYFRGERRTQRIMKVTVWSSLVVFLFAGVSIVTIDQLVTTNITPFMVACVLTAVLFHLSPKESFIAYTITYLFYIWAIGLTQTDQAVLLSNRVNGLTFVGIAIGLSMILWRAAIVTRIQKKTLLRQNDELEEKNAQLQQEAFFDALTQLYNRRAFYKVLTTEQNRMEQNGTTAVVIVLDLDHFKQVNDQFGHIIGDQVLERVGEILKTYWSESALSARWGGEEFIVCMLDANMSQGRLFAEQVRRAITGITIENESGQWTMTASVGVALWDPRNGMNFQMAYQRADEALYRAKKGGRNRVEVYSGRNDFRLVR